MNDLSILLDELKKISEIKILNRGYCKSDIVVKFHFQNKQIDWISLLRLANPVNIIETKYFKKDIETSFIKKYETSNDTVFVKTSKSVSKRFPELFLDVSLVISEGVFNKINKKEVSHTKKIVWNGVVMNSLVFFEQKSSKTSLFVEHRSSKEELFVLIENILKIYCNSNVLLSYSQYDFIIRVSRGVKFCHPKHILLDKVKNITREWIVTPKVDGERRLIVFTNFGVFSFNRATKIFFVDEYCSETLYILDSEYLYDNYEIFDILVYKDVDIRKESLIIRLNYLDTFLKSINTKEFYSLKTLLSLDSLDFVDFLDYIHSDKEFDGMIFINTNGNYYEEQYKVKNVNTYDLLYDGNNLVTYDGKVYPLSTTTSTTTTSTKTTTTTTTTATTNIATRISTMSTLTTNIATRISTTATTSLKEGVIYEVTIQENKVDILRERHDKKTPNRSNVIASWVDTSYFRNNSIKIMRLMQNALKSRLIDISMRKGKRNVLLDIGTGHGRDLEKWSKMDMVFCIEPSEKKLQKLKKIHQNIPSKIHLINRYLSSKDVISFITYPVTMVNIFFSCMMFKEDDIRSLVKIIRKKCIKDVVINIIGTRGKSIDSLVPNVGDIANGYTNNENNKQTQTNIDKQTQTDTNNENNKQTQTDTNKQTQTNTNKQTQTNTNKQTQTNTNMFSIKRLNKDEIIVDIPKSNTRQNREFIYSTENLYKHLDKEGFKEIDVCSLIPTILYNDGRLLESLYETKRFQK